MAAMLTLSLTILPNRFAPASCGNRMPCHRTFRSYYKISMKRLRGSMKRHSLPSVCTCSALDAWIFRTSLTQLAAEKSELFYFWDKYRCYFSRLAQVPYPSADILKEIKAWRQSRDQRAAMRLIPDALLIRKNSSACQILRLYFCIDHYRRQFPLRFTNPFHSIRS